MYFPPGTLESFASRVVANSAACVCGRCPPVGPGLLLARKNRSLASRTSGGPIWRHTENHAFRTERKARLKNEKKRLVGKKDRVRPVEHM